MILNHQIGDQINSENVNKKIFIQNEENSPSLYTPNKESPYLNKDPFKKTPNNNPNEEFKLLHYYFRELSLRKIIQYSF